MLPEISRRCVSCGAAVRAGARFCPQCGQVMSEGNAGGARESSDAAAAAARESESPRAVAPVTRDVQVADESEPPRPARDADVMWRESESQAFGGNDGARVVAPERGARSEVPETGEAASPYAQSPTPHAQAATPLPVETEEAAEFEESASSSEESASSEEKRGRVARVREGTRARVENTRARVERVKDDALFALEEPPDDSGLRFVAVAVVLFVLFLAFLLLSVTVLR